MSIIKDTFFGGAEKKAAKVQREGIERGIAANDIAVNRARKDLGELFPQARQDVQRGFQGALDVLGQTLPAQTQAFQQGNVGAQQTLVNALPQIQNAILGGQIDLSAFQPQRIGIDTGIFQQQLPQAPTGTIANPVFDDGTPFNGPIFNPNNPPVAPQTTETFKSNPFTAIAKNPSSGSLNRFSRIR